MRISRLVVGVAVCLVLPACGKGPAMPTASADQQSPAAAAPATGPAMTVYKDASCGCCGKWVEHMQQHGFATTVHDVDNLNAVKERVGLPFAMGSCHTAEVGGYFIEGHVPASAVARLLKEKPRGKGLAVPGMPVGSPGMEQGDLKQPYDVYLIAEDGSSSVFAHYPQDEAR